MKLFKKSFGKILLAFTALITSVFLLLSSKSIVNKPAINFNQNRFIYSGEYGLFIEIKDGLKFNWFTKETVEGVYELLKSDGSTIIKGETDQGKVHNFRMDLKIKNNIIFKFGGKNETIHEVILKPIPSLEKSSYNNVDSLFVIGDVHGRYDQLIHLMQKSNIIDTDLNWMAGEAHVVFLGDLFDRGSDVTKVLWFIYELEDKAEAAGGKVHLVLGNHEIMTMTKDLRYVSPKEMAIAGAFDKSYDELFHPTKSLLGAWLRSKPSVLKIDKAIFAHGGIVDLETGSVKGFNELVHNYMEQPIYLDIMRDQPDSTKYDPIKWEQMRYFFYSEESPFWYRGYVNSDTLAPQLKTMLRKYNSNVHIVAHTPLETITQRYKGDLLTTDLKDAATQLLLLVKKKRKYERFKIDSAGIITELK